MKQVLAALALASVLSPHFARAETIGVAEGFNVFVRGSMALSSGSIEGRAAIGGNATLSSFSIGNASALQSDALRYDLVVGGHAALANGSVDKGSAHAATASSQGVGYRTAGAGMTTGGTAPVDFNAAWVGLTQLSEDLAALTGNGSSLLQWGGLTLTGTDADLNVFDLDARDLMGIHTLNIVVPTTSTVLFNVSGTGLEMRNMGIHVNGAQNNAMSSRMLWNFTELATFTLDGLSWRGSILAPSAALSFGNGELYGQVIVSSLGVSPGRATSAAYKDHAFAGSLPFEATLPGGGDRSSVPEPPVMLLLAAAGAAAGIGRLRRKVR